MFKFDSNYCSFNFTPATSWSQFVILFDSLWSELQSRTPFNNALIVFSSAAKCPIKWQLVIGKSKNHRLNLLLFSLVVLWSFRVVVKIVSSGKVGERRFGKTKVATSCFCCCSFSGLIENKIFSLQAVIHLPQLLLNNYIWN